jgi:TrmH family RNA methyltransferase
MKITSATNLKVKQVIRLKDRSHRQKDQLTVIEGVREVSRAIEAGVRISSVLICPEYLERQTDLTADVTKLRPLLEKISKPLETTAEVFRKMAFGERKEGVIAVGSLPKRSLQQIKISSGLLAVADGIEKPGNLGAILRTCDAAGVDGLIVCGGTDIDNPNVIRASLGTVFTVPVVAAVASEVVTFLREKKIKIFTAVPEGKVVYTGADFSRACAIVLGSEQKGVHSEWQKACDETVRIPMKGRADSLNVSAAAAILIFEARRQKGR